jgi:hypothetical protein
MDEPELWLCGAPAEVFVSIDWADREWAAFCGAPQHEIVGYCLSHYGETLEPTEWDGYPIGDHERITETVVGVA